MVASGTTPAMPGVLDDPLFGAGAVLMEINLAAGTLGILTEWAPATPTHAP
jgi:hypothetical protein